MAGSSAGAAPVIIRKKKNIIAAGHHGGAWKVAYADFATAMMAFFLLMWLLNATTEAQRKGLADYFNPSIPISKVSGGGSDALGGSSVMSEESLIDDGSGQGRRLPKTGMKDGESKAHSMAELVDEMQKIEEQINEQMSDALKPEIAKHIFTRMTPDGLMIELVDGRGDPLFKPGSAEPTGIMLQLIEIMGPVLSAVSNDMSLSGHTDAHALIRDNGYSNWELSSERALTARRLLIGAGIENRQIVEVAGKADTEPFSDDIYSPQNRRIAITLLTMPREKSTDN